MGCKYLRKWNVSGTASAIFNAKKAFDIAACNRFNATPLTAVPTAGTATDVVTPTTNGTVTITNNVALGNGHVKAIVDLMKERNIPTSSSNSSATDWPR